MRFTRNNCNIVKKSFFIKVANWEKFATDKFDIKICYYAIVR